MANYDSELPIRSVAADNCTEIADSGGTTIDPAVTVAQGSATAGETGTLVQGAVTTAAPVYTTAQTSPLSLTTGGALRVDISAGGTVDVNIDQVAGTATDVNTGNASNGTQRVVLASDQPTVATDTATVAGTATDVNTGNASNGTQRVVLASDQPTVATDLATVAGTATDVNTGNASNGTQRVVLASDQPTIPVAFAGFNDEKPTYATFNIAVAGSHSFTYAPAATESLNAIDVSGSGQLFITVQWGLTGGETTKVVGFTSKSNLNYHLDIPNGIDILNTQTVKVTVVNEDKQAFDVFCTIWTNP